MNTVYFLVQQTMFFSIPLLIVALGGMFSERSGVVNIALEGIMIMGAFSSILFINIVQSSGAALPPQLLLLLAVLIAAAVGVLVSMAHAYASINMKADQVPQRHGHQHVRSGFAIFAARMIRSVQQIPFSNTFASPRYVWAIFRAGGCCSRILYHHLSGLCGAGGIGCGVVQNAHWLRLRACGEHPQAADSVA
jgi:simple sugar transport system permease protein